MSFLLLFARVRFFLFLAKPEESREETLLRVLLAVALPCGPGLALGWRGIRQRSFHCGLLGRLGAGRRQQCRGRSGHGRHLVTRRVVVFLSPNPAQRELGRLHGGVGHQNDTHLKYVLDLREHGPLFVEQEIGDDQRQLRHYLGRAFLARFLADHPKHMQAQRFHAADSPGAAAPRAGLVGHVDQRGAQSLARHLQNSEARNLSDLDPGRLVARGLAQPFLHLAVGAGRTHIDEVDHDEARQVTYAALTGNLVGRLEVGLQCGLFDIFGGRGAGGVDVDADARLRLVDDDLAAGRQVYAAAVCRVDLALDLVAVEQRAVALVAAQPIQEVRHGVLHETAYALVGFVVVHHDFGDRVGQVVANRPQDHAGFLNHQKGTVAFQHGQLDGFPGLQLVVQVPLQLFGASVMALGTDDYAHALRNLEFPEPLLNGLAIFAAHLARNAAATRIIGVQDQVAAGQRNQGAERCALGVPLVLLHLDHQLLAFVHQLGDVQRLAGFRSPQEVLAGYVLQWKKAVALCAEIHKGSLQAGFYARNAPLVDIAPLFFLFPVLNGKVIEFLSIDKSNAHLFLLGGVYQHSFHCESRVCSGGATRQPRLAAPTGRAGSSA